MFTKESPLRFSRLKMFNECPAYFAANPSWAGASQDKGTAVHAVLLQDKKVTYFDRVTDSGKAAPRNGRHWDDFQAAHAGEIILSRGDYEDTMAMAESVRANKDAMDLLRGPGVVNEATVEFDYLGVACRATADARKPGVYVAELKSTKSSNPKHFERQCRQLSYHGQTSFYTLPENSPNRTIEQYIVAVANTAPYITTVFKLNAATRVAGEKMVRGWMEQLTGCLASKHFPAYSQGIAELNLAYGDEDDAV